MRLLPRRDRIAVVEMFGTIGGGIKSAPYERVFGRVRDARNVAALVLDIDSPGGSVPASEYIHRCVARVAERKPVVASIRGVGASGGYMVACGAHAIVASPGAMVGSIGVISVRPMLSAAMQKLGIDVGVNKSGEFKDMGAVWRPSTPEEEARMQALIDESYGRFISIVSGARGLDDAAVGELATGEVFWAPRALEAGLVDRIGDLDLAVSLAADLAGCRRRVVRMGPKRGLGQRLFGPAMDSLVESVAGEIERRIWMQALR